MDDLLLQLSRLSLQQHQTLQLVNSNLRPPLDAGWKDLLLIQRRNQKNRKADSQADLNTIFASVMDIMRRNCPKTKNDRFKDFIDTFNTYSRIVRQTESTYESDKEVRPLR